jgi:hypothetical protein
MSAQIVPVIMCVGAGTRLWPVSRESKPKQFVPLVGDHDAAGNATDGPVVCWTAATASCVRRNPCSPPWSGSTTSSLCRLWTPYWSARAKAEAGEDAGRAAQGAQSSRGCRAPPRLSSGYYQDVDMAPRYRVKRIVVKPGSKLTLQKHFHRPSIGSRSRERPRSRSAMTCAACTKTNPSISRSAAFIGSPIPARSRSN